MSLSTPDLRAAGGRGSAPAGTPRAAGPATAVFRPAGSSGESAPSADPRPLPWLLGGVGAVALVALGGWALVLAPQAASTAALEDQAVQTGANEAQLTTKVAQLQAQFSDLPQYQADLARARAQVPTDPDLADLLRALRDAAASTGVTLTGVVPAAPEAAATATGAAAADPAATTGATEAATDSATAATAGAAGAATTTTTTDPATGLVRVPLTLTATGGYTAVTAFLAAVQQQDRLVLLTSVALSPSTASDGQTLLTLTASGSAFALPATDAEVTAAAATAPATASPAPSADPTALPATVLTAATPAATR